MQKTLSIDWLKKSMLENSVTDNKLDSCLLPDFDSDLIPNGFSVYGIIHFYSGKKGSILKAVMSKFAFKEN